MNTRADIVADWEAALGDDDLGDPSGPEFVRMDVENVGDVVWRALDARSLTMAALMAGRRARRG